jgi:hypothetical protein
MYYDGKEFLKVKNALSTIALILKPARNTGYPDVKKMMTIRYMAAINQ